MRVLVASEPRAYREVLGRAIADLRPAAAVTVAEPDRLDDLLTLMSPDLVIASRLPAATVPAGSRLVLVYPNGTSGATIMVDGVLTTVADLPLDALLALVDAMDAAEIARTRETPDRPAA